MFRVKCPVFVIPLDMLSRWKGMETRWLKQDADCYLVFGYAFPLEGNGNTNSSDIEQRPCFLWICFPVGREWKPVLSDAQTSALPFTLWICFPVGREWKRMCTRIGMPTITIFGYTFPFEGNGNISWCAMPARSPVFGDTFPFEGNGNIRSFGWVRWFYSCFGDTFPREGNRNKHIPRFQGWCW